MPTSKQTDGAAKKKSRKVKHHEDKLKLAKAIAKPEPKAQREGRLRRTVAEALKPQRYVKSPAYGEHDNHAGATSMSVVIGPMQGAPGMYGSKPAANTPTVMRKLLDGEHNDHGWIAGHLLNDNLGGPGVAWNLTPLTTAGNKNHLNTCETKIKNFITSAYSRIEFNPKDAYWYGVDYRVEVSKVKWDSNDPVLKHVATHLTVWARVVRIDKKKPTSWEAVSADDCPITGTWFDPIVAEKVDNTGYESLGMSI